MNFMFFLPDSCSLADDVTCVLFPLQAAGNAVKRASDNLVRAAQKAAFGKADDDDVVVKTKFVGGIAQVSGQTHSGVRLPRQGF